MTAITEVRAETRVRATAEERRATVVGWLLVLVAVFVAWVFGLGVPSDAQATFNLSLPTDTVQGLQWIVTTRTLAFISAGVIAVLGAIAISRRWLKLTNVFLGIAMALFVLSFLAWAAAGKSFSLVGLMRSTVILSVAIALGALTGIMGERAGVVNIGIEGQMLSGAFVGTILGSAFGLWTGLVGAVLIGGVLGAFLGWLAIRFRVDQIIAGVAINILALGFTSLMASRVLAEAQDLNAPPTFPAIRIPGLADIPVIGPLLFDHTMFVYVTFALVALMHLGLFHTRWGLRARSVGEHPKAADTAGINVYRTRYVNVILGGLIAGFGGAFLTLAQVPRFEENMTGGVGFIGLAAMIFGRWMPVGALAASLVFGFAQGLAQKLGILSVPIPSEFLLMIPYVTTIVVVAGVVGRARPPAADGQPYVKD